MLLAVELLLFELKPRSLVPVALASAAAAAVCAASLLGAGPLFPAADVDVAAAAAPTSSVACAVVGARAPARFGAADAPSVYAAEDAFARLHAALDVVAGAGRPGRRPGRLICPQALGVATTRSRRCCSASSGVGQTLRLMAVKATSGRSRSARARRAACWRRCS